MAVAGGRADEGAEGSAEDFYGFVFGLWLADIPMGVITFPDGIMPCDLSIVRVGWS